MAVYLGVASRVLLAGVFFAAALGKLRNIDAATSTVRRLGTPRILTPLLTRVLIGYEGVVALALALGAVPLLTSVAVAALLLVFISVSIFAQATNRMIPCNCFGTTQTFLGPETLIRSIGLAFPLAGYFLTTRLDTSRWLLETPTPQMAVVSMSLAVAAFLIVRWAMVSRQLTKLVRVRRAAESQNLGKLIAKGSFREAK